MKITINKPTEFEAVYLKVDAGVRYWEDAEVNGVKDFYLYSTRHRRFTYALCCTNKRRG